MNYLVVLVVNNIDDCSAVLDAWEDCGVPGVTIISSTGLGHIRKAGLRDDIPLMPSLSGLFASDEEQHRTLFSVVNGEEIIDKMVLSAQTVIGDFEEEKTGFLFVVPVVRAVGLAKKNSNQSK